LHSGRYRPGAAGRSARQNYTLTDAHGALTLTGVPPRNYSLKLWRETLGEQAKEVKVTLNAEVKVAFGFKGF
jgi:hypothetical protein